MLWIIPLFMLLVGNNTPQEMKLKFSSTEYRFRNGSATLFRKEAQDVITVSLANGNSEKVAVSTPGFFTVILHNVEVLRIRDNKQFQVTHHLVREFEITEQNLKRGWVEIPIKARGAYRVIALDRNEKPVQGATRYFFNADEGIELKTNSEGEIIFLGSLNDYSNSKELPQGPLIWWKILPL